MNAIWDWAKENFDLISLLVGLIGVVIAVISLMYEIKKSQLLEKRGIVIAWGAHGTNWIWQRDGSFVI